MATRTCRRWRRRVQMRAAAWRRWTKPVVPCRDAQLRFTQCRFGGCEPMQRSQRPIVCSERVCVQQSFGSVGRMSTMVMGLSICWNSANAT